jgi:hypothetical protein
MHAASVAVTSIMTALCAAPRLAGQQAGRAWHSPARVAPTRKQGRAGASVPVWQAVVGRRGCGCAAGDRARSAASPAIRHGGHGESRTRAVRGGGDGAGAAGPARTLACPPVSRPAT